MKHECTGGNVDDSEKKGAIVKYDKRRMSGKGLGQKGGKVVHVGDGEVV